MIAIVDYEAGNLTSVKLALDEIQVQSVITSNAGVILNADRVVFPGVGAAGSAMEAIHRFELAPVLQSFIDTGKPFLGICVGCQIIMDTSLEDGNTQCLGFLPGSTAQFQPKRAAKVPHMGWNQVHQSPLTKDAHPVFHGIPNGSEFYFVHSYYPTPTRSEDIVATTEYGGLSFASVLARRNLLACQFHAEKSGKWGLQFLKNFSQWKPNLNAD